MRFIASTLTLLALAAAVPAAAFDTLDDVRCACADGALGAGDYASCIAHLTRRLQAGGLIAREERQAAINAAAHEDLAALQADCAEPPPAFLEGWGVLILVRAAFFPAPTPSGTHSMALGTLRLWNASPQDVYQEARFTPVATAPTDEGCTFRLRVLDASGRIVREAAVDCLDATAPLDLPVGTMEERSFEIPLVALNADPATGLPDGERLPIGTYVVQGSWIVQGPNRSPAVTSAGSEPAASITIRVGT